MREIEVKARTTEPERIRAELDSRLGEGREVHKRDHYFHLPGVLEQSLRIRCYDGKTELTTKHNRRDEEGENYEFRFLTKEESMENDEDHHWFLVRDILDFHAYPDVNKYLIKTGLMDSSKHSEKKCDFANETLFQLYRIVYDVCMNP